jgi:hypothetical protein
MLEGEYIDSKRQSTVYLYISGHCADSAGGNRDYFIEELASRIGVTPDRFARIWRRSVNWHVGRRLFRAELIRYREFSVCTATEYRHCRRGPPGVGDGEFPQLFVLGFKLAAVFDIDRPDRQMIGG